MLPKYGSPRLLFPRGQQRLFIENIIKKSGFNVNKLARMVDVSSRTIRDWKREKLHIPLKAIRIFCSNSGVSLPPKTNRMIVSWRKKKLEISKMGAESRFKKYGPLGTVEGRRRGGKKTMRILRSRGIIPPMKKFQQPIKNERLAEFIGIVLGDGGITPFQIQITLNSIADKKYLFFVKNLFSDLFQIEPSVFKKRDCNANVIYCNGMNLVRIMTSLGLRVGNKVRQQVGVPDWIKSNTNFSIACLRGLMDTDGGIFTHRYIVNGKLYKYNKGCFSNRSIPLLDFVYETLKKVGLNPKTNKKSKMVNKQVWLYNMAEVKKYFHLVGSSNQRLLKYQNSYFPKGG